MIDKQQTQKHITFGNLEIPKRPCPIDPEIVPNPRKQEWICNCQYAVGPILQNSLSFQGLSLVFPAVKFKDGNMKMKFGSGTW